MIVCSLTYPLPNMVILVILSGGNSGIPDCYPLGYPVPNLVLFAVLG